MLHIHGLIAIPSDPKISIVKPESSSGFFINFQAVTQGKTVDNKAEYQYWTCMVWVPEQDIDKWEKEYLQPGNVLYIEYASALSIPIMDGKYHNTKIKLDHGKTKKLSTAMWIK
jgi:hypothetical protein